MPGAAPHALCALASDAARPLDRGSLCFQFALPELAPAALFSSGGSWRANPTRRAVRAREILALLTGGAGPGVAVE